MHRLALRIKLRQKWYLKMQTGVVMKMKLILILEILMYNKIIILTKTITMMLIKIQVFLSHLLLVPILYNLPCGKMLLMPVYMLHKVIL